MASSMTNYLEEILLNHMFRTATFSKPTVIACGLATAVANYETGSLTEVANSGSYARTTLNPLDANWSDPSAGTQGETDNSSAITFPTATGSWGTVTATFLADNATYGAGNIWYIGDLDASKTVDTSDTVSFAVGAFNVQMN